MTLKANNVPSSGSGQKLTAPDLEPGNYPARIVQIVDLGVQKQRAWEGQEKAPQNEIMVTYELAGEFMVGEDGQPDETKPRWLTERFSLFPLFADRAKSTARYKALDPTEQYGGDWTQLLGAACLVTVVNNVSKKNGKTYSNVGGITPPIRGMEVPALVNEGKIFTQDEPDMAVYAKLPDWIKGIIEEGIEYGGSKLRQIIDGVQANDVDGDQGAERRENPAKGGGVAGPDGGKEAEGAEQGGGEVWQDEDVPF